MTLMEKEDANLINKNKKQIKKDKKKKKVKKTNTLFYKLLSFLLIILSVSTIGYTIYKEIFSLFYMIPISLVLLIIVFIIAYILNSKLRRWIKNIFSFISFLIIIFEILMILFGTNTLKFLSSLTDTGYRVESFGVYVLNDSQYSKVEDLNDKYFYYLNHDDNKSINEVIKKLQKKISFDYDYKDNAIELVDGLIDSKVDAIIMDRSYESILLEEHSEKFSKLKMIDQFDIVGFVNTIQSDVDITKDPFVVYISGIDTSGNVASKARSDVNILLGVNPDNKTILMVNTPRDYYVTLNSKKKKDKLTHSGLYGVEESLNTLSDLYDVDIDYYVRINFTSFIKIVNSLGGIKVNVPIKFCEQDSKRSFAEEDLICLNKGVQTLNGEQALALARHRHTLPTGDRGRGENQMLVLEAIINKAMSPKIISKYSSLIDALQGRVTTNMKTNEMYRFAKKQLKEDFSWNYYRMSATGADSRGVCYATGSGKAYVMEPDLESVDKIKEAFDNLFDGKELTVE